MIILSRMVCFLLITLVMAGCNAVQRPNRPGTAEVTRTQLDPSSGKPSAVTHVKVTNDENPKGPLSASVGDEGATIGTGGSTKFEWSSFDGTVLLWLGGFLVVVGLAFEFVPYLHALVAGSKVGLYVAAAGGAMLFVPWIGEGIKPMVPVVSLIVIVGLAFYLAVRLGIIHKRISPQVEADLLASDDIRAAGAVRRIRTGSAAEAKVVATPVVELKTQGANP